MTAGGGFNDHFGKVADHYADSRPGYPTQLFAWLAAQCAQHALAWDCGTGSGQAAVELAQHFRHVLASDASTAQIAKAGAHPRIDYRVAPAEHSDLDAACVDLVTVAQALHWFDLDAFYAEVRRVLKPGGLIAAWSYGVFKAADETIDAPLQHFYHQVVGPYWPAERRHVENGYRELAFPFQAVPAPTFAMRADWTLAQLLGYLRSWSATARFIEAKGGDPVADLESLLGECWGDAQRQRRIEWPLTLLAGRLPA